MEPNFPNLSSLPDPTKTGLSVIVVCTLLTCFGCSGDSIDGISLERTASAEEAHTLEAEKRGMAALDARRVDLGQKEAGAITVAVVSDLNASYGSRWYPEPVHRAVDRLIEMQPDLVISAGDMVAGQQPGLDYPGMWNAFHNAVSDRLFDAGIPFAPSPGNHDASGYPQYANERGWYENAWKLRRPDVEFVEDSHYPFRYAFTVGNALFVSLDATVARPLPEVQRRWLRNVLEDNKHVKARIVFGHLPIYPFAEGRRWDILDDTALERLLKEYDVDIYVSGHHQAYYTGRRGSLRMVSTGCLGNGVRRLLGQPNDSVRTVVLLEINEKGDVAVEALTGDHFRQPVQLSSLPASVGERHRVVHREDTGPALPALPGVDIEVLEEELRGRVFEEAITTARPR